MKILHPLLCYYPSQAGGPANTVYWINNSLNSEKYTCEVIATSFGLTESLTKKSFSHNHKASYFNSAGRNYLSRGLKELRNTDILQLSSLFFPPTLPLLVAAARRSKTIIISPRGELYGAAIKQKFFKKKLWLTIVKLFQKKINFHASNDFELEIIKKTFPKAMSTILIPNYIELPKKQDRAIEEKIIFLGRINPIKNIHLLIDALNIVRKQFPDIKLEILGLARLDYEITYKKALENQIKELGLQNIVHFKGHLDGEDKNKIIASSKALILPSKSENFGNVVLESLAQGTPVIASKNTPWGILEEYNAGYWINTTSDDLANYIIKIFSLDQQLYEKMRNNSRLLCEYNFDIKNKINVWEDYYSKLTSK